MELELLETSAASFGPVGKHLGAGARAEAVTEPKPGEAHTFKQVTASVLPLLNTGRLTDRLHGNRTGQWARPGRSDSACTPALPLPPGPTSNRDDNTAVSRLHNSRPNAIGPNPEATTVPALHNSADNWARKTAI